MEIFPYLQAFSPKKVCIFRPRITGMWSKDFGAFFAFKTAHAPVQAGSTGGRRGPEPPFLPPVHPARTGPLAFPKRHKPPILFLP